MEAPKGLAVQGPARNSQFREDTSTRSWERIADDWIAHADRNDYRNYYLMPRMLAMLGNVAGKRILDLGCGEGGYARELARRGAHVTGVDGSERLLKVAIERARIVVEISEAGCIFLGGHQINRDAGFLHRGAVVIYTSVHFLGGLCQGAVQAEGGSSGGAVLGIGMIPFLRRIKNFRR